MKNDLFHILKGNVIIIGKNKSYNRRRNTKIDYDLTIILLQHGILKKLMMDYYMLSKEYRNDDGTANLDNIEKLIDRKMRFPFNLPDKYEQFVKSFFDIKKSLERRRKIKKLNE